MGEAENKRILGTSTKQRKRKMSLSELATLTAQLEELNAKIAAAKAENTKVAKLARALASCKVTHKTMHRYVSLQELYMNTLRGI